jgi:transposase
MRVLLLRVHAPYRWLVLSALRASQAPQWIVFTVKPWRDLSKHYGNCNSVWKQFRYWALNGVWEKIFTTFPIGADLEEMLMDSTIIHAHQHKD